MNYGDKVIYKGKRYYVMSICNVEGRNWSYYLAKTKDAHYSEHIIVWIEDEHLVLPDDKSVKTYTQLKLF
jgi:hypothetical protein